MYLLFDLLFYIDISIDIKRNRDTYPLNGKIICWNIPFLGIQRALSLKTNKVNSLGTLQKVPCIIIFLYLLLTKSLSSVKSTHLYFFLFWKRRLTYMFHFLDNYYCLHYACVANLFFII